MMSDGMAKIKFLGPSLYLRRRSGKEPAALQEGRVVVLHEGQVPVFHADVG